MAIVSAVDQGSQSPAQSPQEPPSFRTGVELVQLDVSVLDNRRQPIAGLAASDFTLLEDGKPRPIRAFTPVHLVRSADRASGMLSAPGDDVATNRAGEDEGRIVVILMDRSIPPEQPTLIARRVAEAAVNALGPHDLAALISTSGGIPQNLTADRARVIDAIRQRDWSTDISKEQAAIIGKQDPLSDGRCLCGLCVLETIDNVAKALQNAPRRRKILLFIGSRMIVQAGLRAPSADVGCDTRVRDARRKLFDTLALSNLTVHALDPSGLVTVSPPAGVGGSRPGGDQQAFRRLALQGEITELLSNQGSIQVLPDLTGGRAVRNTNAPEEKVPDIFAETDTYYVLGFEPGEPGRRDVTRSIEIKVARAGAHVVAQRKYVVPRSAPALSPAPAGSPPSSLARALTGLLPDARRPLTLTTAAFAGDSGGKTRVLINVDAGAFAREDNAPVTLDFGVAAYDRAGHPKTFAHESARVTFKPAAAGRGAEANVQTHLDLAPGDYEIRVAVSDPAKGVAASVFSAAVLPSFGTDPLSLSDVIVETLVPGVPPGSTNRRVFERGESVRATVQIYQGVERTETINPVSVRARISDANGRVARDQMFPLRVNDFVNRRAGLAFDIGQLPAGEFVLALEASSGGYKKDRALRFAVR